MELEVSESSDRRRGRDLAIAGFFIVIGAGLGLLFGQTDLGNQARRSATRTIGGAIVQTRIDNTHPIAFGFNSEMPLFRRGSTFLKASENPFASPVHYSEEPVLSGYIGEQRLAEMSGQPAVIAERQGKGLVVRFANNPIFRGFWRGTERLWINALYFGPLVRTTELPQ